MIRNNRLAALLLTLVLLATGCAAHGEEAPAESPAPVVTEQTPVAVPEQEQTDPLMDAAAWLQEKTPEPTVNSIGGEWLVLGMARSGVEVPDGYFEAYYQNVEAHVAACQGVLDARKYTEYSRVILALTAIGKDPADVAGYNLLAPLADYDQTVFQGINGPVFALLALDSTGYSLPECPAGKTQATRETYLQMLLDKELEGGGWSFAGGAVEADMTAMALQALAKYRDVEPVAEAVERGVEILSGLQNEQGGFTLNGEASCETAAQVVVALTELGIRPDEERFVKNGVSALDWLLSFRTADGGFSHLPGGEADQMATEQAFYALAAVYRLETGMSSLYDMQDVG